MLAWSIKGLGGYNLCFRYTVLSTFKNNLCTSLFIGFRVAEKPLAREFYSSLKNIGLMGIVCGADLTVG